MSISRRFQAILVIASLVTGATGTASMSRSGKVRTSTWSRPPTGCADQAQTRTDRHVEGARGKRAQADAVANATTTCDSCTGTAAVYRSSMSARQGGLRRTTSPPRGRAAATAGQPVCPCRSSSSEQVHARHTEQRTGGQRGLRRLHDRSDCGAARGRHEKARASSRAKAGSSWRRWRVSWRLSSRPAQWRLGSWRRRTRAV